MRAGFDVRLDQPAALLAAKRFRRCRAQCRHQGDPGHRFRHRPFRAAECHTRLLRTGAVAGMRSLMLFQKLRALIDKCPVEDCHTMA